MGRRGEPNGMVLVSLEGWEEGVRHKLEFRERGVERPLSRRRSKLVPCLAIWGRDLSLEGSMALASLSSGDRVGESSVSSATGEPDERLCIGGGGVGTHPARFTQQSRSWHRVGLAGPNSDRGVEGGEERKGGEGRGGREGVEDWNVREGQRRERESRYGFVVILVGRRLGGLKRKKKKKKKKGKRVPEDAVFLLLLLWRTGATLI